MLHEGGGDTVEGDTYFLLFVFLCPPDTQKATVTETSAGHQPSGSESDKAGLCAMQPAPVQDTVGEVRFLWRWWPTSFTSAPGRVQRERPSKANFYSF